jgi:hypothetical protein
MDPFEREAASILAASLALANTAEFLDGIDRVFQEFDRNVLTTTEALWQIRRLRAAMVTSNAKLRQLTRSGQLPPADLGGPCLP